MWEYTSLGMKPVSQDMINSFWVWFKANQTAFDGEVDYEVYMSLVKKLREVDARLTLDIDRRPGQDKTAIISSDDRKGAFSAVLKVADSAPEMAGWKVLAFRPRQGPHIQMNVDGLLMESGDVFFTWEKSKRLMDLKVYLPDYISSDGRYERMGDMLVENLVGEYDKAMKIGKIEFKDLEEMRGSEDLLPLVRLPRTLDEAFGGRN
jgi:hypothetical protein